MYVLPRCLVLNGCSMTPPIPVIGSGRLISATILLLILVPPSYAEYSASLDQIYYQDGTSEYCYNESYNLGTCLGKQRLELLDYSQEKLVRCTECSGNFDGYDTCDELKALNDVDGGLGLGDGGTSSAMTTAVIDWDESSCEAYDRCVKENCPEQCRGEQDAWLECLVVQLDCDWRCPEWGEDIMGNVGAFDVMNNGSPGVDGTVLPLGLRACISGLLLRGLMSW